MSKARYCSNVVNTDIGRVIQVIDLFDDSDPTMSVTNDAEAVVEEVVKLHGDHPIVYRDTEGRWDQLVHQNGEFTRFAPIKCSSLAFATQEA